MIFCDLLNMGVKNGTHIVTHCRGAGDATQLGQPVITPSSDPAIRKVGECAHLVRQHRGQALGDETRVEFVELRDPQ